MPTFEVHFMGRELTATLSEATLRVEAGTCHYCGEEGPVAFEEYHLEMLTERGVVLPLTNLWGMVLDILEERLLAKRPICVRPACAKVHAEEVRKSDNGVAV